MVLHTQTAFGVKSTWRKLSNDVNRGTVGATEIRAECRCNSNLSITHILELQIWRFEQVRKCTHSGTTDWKMAQQTI